jgi:hypothetical protein
MDLYFFPAGVTKKYDNRNFYELVRLPLLTCRCEYFTCLTCCQGQQVKLSSAFLLIIGWFCVAANPRSDRQKQRPSVMRSPISRVMYPVTRTSTGCNVPQTGSRWPHIVEGTGAFPGKFMWDFWWTKCHWDRLLSHHFGFFSCHHSTNAPCPYLHLSPNGSFVLVLYRTVQNRSYVFCVFLNILHVKILSTQLAECEILVLYIEY